METWLNDGAPRGRIEPSTTQVKGCTLESLTRLETCRIASVAVVPTALDRNSRARTRPLDTLGAEAYVHIWGVPVLDGARQTLRLDNIELAVESEAAMGLLGAAAMPHLQRVLAEKASVDLKPFASNAQKKIAAAIADLQKSEDGVRVTTDITSLIERRLNWVSILIVLLVRKARHPEHICIEGMLLEEPGERTY